jgi:hypothetical protein
MLRLLIKVISWMIGKFLLLLLLIVALLLAPSVMEAWRVVGQFDPISEAREIKKQIESLVPGKGAPIAEIEHKAKMLRDLLAQKKLERADAARQSCFLPTCSIVKNAKRYRIELEMNIIEQALSYGEAIRAGRKVCDEGTRSIRELEELKRVEADLEHARPFWLPSSREHSEQTARLREREKKQIALETMCKAYQRLSNTFEADPNAARQKPGPEYAAFLSKLEQLKQSRSAFVQSAREVLPVALMTLLAIIFLPLGLKLFSYYAVAPLASRRFGLRLLPDTSGDLRVESPSQHLQRINLEKGWELLIDPALLRSAPDSAATRTRILLDWRLPFSSIVSGQYLLTRIRDDSNGTVTVSDDRHASSMLTVLDLPEHAALVLQPRCLAGIVQRIDRPIRITRSWRIGNLGSWLTLQLGYVVFHGPAKLIVSGNHGVEADPAQGGSSINQAATLGFSANLGYGVARCDPFYAYLSGKAELFNDCFSAGPGYYIHEVRPRPVRKSLLPGRGIEGILNSLLKIFGL